MPQTILLVIFTGKIFIINIKQNYSRFNEYKPPVKSAENTRFDLFERTHLSILVFKRIYSVST